MKVIKQIASCCWFSNLNFFKKRSLFSSVNHFIFKSDDDSRDLCHLFGKTADGRNGSDQGHRRTWRVSAPPRTVGFGRPRRGLVPGHDRTSTDECKEARNLKKLQKNTFKISIAKKVKMIRKQKNNDYLTKNTIPLNI